MLDKKRRYEMYNNLGKRVGELLAMDGEIAKHDPHVNRTKQLREERESMEARVVGDAITLLMSTVEALHVIAEGQIDIAKAARREQGWKPSDDVQQPTML